MTTTEAALALRQCLVAAHKAKGSALTEAEWLAIAVKELEAAIQTLPKRQKAVKPSFSMGAGLSDDVWLAELASHPALTGVNFRQEVESCRLWASSRGVKPSRKRLVNWMLKAVADRPFKPTPQGQFAGAAPARQSQVEPEPMGWREEFPDFIGIQQPWEQIDATNRAYITKKMAELAKSA